MPAKSPAALSLLNQPAEAPPASPFWTFQLVIWHAYGLVLMLPWLGTYPVGSMLPNKLVIAGSGLLASTGLRAVYRAALWRGPRLGALIPMVLLTSVAAGFGWDILLAELLGGPVSQDLRRLGALGSGIPQLAGGFYHALVLLTWSVVYLALKHYPSQAASPVRGGRPGQLVLRDGKHALLVDAEELKWVEAAGDYVRLHAGPKRLLLRATMARIAATLPAADYLRIHRSAIVRLAEVRELIPLPNSEYEVLLRDGTSLRASRTYADRLRVALSIEPIVKG